MADSPVAERLPLIFVEFYDRPMTEFLGELQHQDLFDKIN